ncbi:MAG: fatty acid desaturase [Sedimentitalea sp.]
MPHQNLLTPDQRSRLTTRSNRAGLIHLALYLALLGLCSAAIIAQIPYWPLFLLPQGTLLVFLFTLSHECTHQTPFRTPWLNDAVGHALSPILLLPFLWFRYFHLAHHKHTNDPEKDPEIADHPHPQTRAEWLTYLSGWGFWTNSVRTLWANARGDLSAPYLPKRQHRIMRREARAILAVYALAALSLLITPAILWLWLLPMVIAQPLLRAYLLAEHGLCPQVANMLENTRTTFTNRILRFVAWNMPYHAEHHSFPAVPFHQLPALHAELAPHLKSTAPGYGAFTRAYLRSLEH